MPARHLPNLGGWEHLIAEFAYEAALNAYDMALTAIEEGGVPVHPPGDKIFAALQQTPPERVRVVILGQDPYHGPGQANGLAFSVNPGQKLPPSLRNIFKELHSDINCEIPSSGDLTKWAQQGVLLLNTTLTVFEGQPNSCIGWGWDVFTGAILNACEHLPQPIVYILWGVNAQKVGAKVGKEAGKTKILGNHPSPLSANRGGFFGTKPFSGTNAFLEKYSVPPIDWSLQSFP